MNQKEACDLWTAAFFQPLRYDVQPITSAAVANHLADRPVDPRVSASGKVIALRECFFHWPLEFPEVFADGGFDVILSNPPWEHVELKEQEFFAARDARIAGAPTKATRAKLIRELPKTNRKLYQEYLEALRSFDAARLFLAQSGRYPLTGRGRINTYAVFAELVRNLIRSGGRAGIIVPTGIATDDTTKFFFQALTASAALASLYDFENRKGIFPSVHKSYKFSLITLREGMVGKAAEFVFFALSTDDIRKGREALHPNG